MLVALSAARDETIAGQLVEENRATGVYISRGLSSISGMSGPRQDLFSRPVKGNPMINPARRLIRTVSVGCTLGATALLAPIVSDAQANVVNPTSVVNLDTCNVSALSQPFVPWSDFSRLRACARRRLRELDVDIDWRDQACRGKRVVRGNGHRRLLLAVSASRFIRPVASNVCGRGLPFDPFLHCRHGIGCGGRRGQESGDPCWRCRRRRRMVADAAYADELGGAGGAVWGHRPGVPDIHRPLWQSTDR